MPQVELQVGDILVGQYDGTRTICLLAPGAKYGSTLFWQVIGLDGKYRGVKGTYTEHTLRLNLNKKLGNDKLLVKLYE